ncbi:MAG: hypothetical protein MHM6MM_001917 [Cercozoa sp. M6MM]
MGGLISKLMSLFFEKHIEVCLVGLENAGKSTFCNQMAFGPNDIEEPPTVGLNVRIMKKEGVQFKVWDIGGQRQYRSEWPRYTRGCDVIIFLVDAADVERLDDARHELHKLLDDRELAGMPLLVLANKIDLPTCVPEDELIRALNLDYISENAWMVVPLSAKNGTNIDKAVKYLLKYAR